MRKIDTERKPPWELLAHERLLIRLPKNHEKYPFISQRVYQLRAGYSGEVEVDHILPEIGLPKEHRIFKNIQLEVLPNFYIQLDTLILTRHFLILMEIKKYAGTIFFEEEQGKTIKVSPNQDIEKFECAAHQIDRAVHGLHKILENFPNYPPIIPILVMANAKVEIAKYPQSVPVKYKMQLPKYIRTKLATQEQITTNEFSEIEKQIQTHMATKQRTPLCERYEIPIAALKKGVLCPHCNEKMEKKQGRSWTCQPCRLTSHTLIHQTIEDWFYLISHTLTNQQLCQFLDVHTKSASHILSQLTLRKIGQTSNAYYIQKNEFS